jgi:hypothetical protein
MLLVAICVEACALKRPALGLYLCILLDCALARGDAGAVSAALSDLGVVTERNDVPLRAEMGYGMFDTRGKVRAGVGACVHLPTS